MNPKEAQQIFNDEYQKALKSTPFPDDLIPVQDRFDNVKHTCLQTESQITMGMSFPEYKVFVMKRKGYTLFEMAQLINMFQRKTPADFMGNPDYYDIQEQIHFAAIEWQKLVDPLKEAINRKIDIMANNVRGINGKPMKIIH